MTEVESEILTLEEVAAYLKAGKRTVYRLAQKGEIPAFKLGGTWRFRRSELDRWIAETCGLFNRGFRWSNNLPSSELAGAVPPALDRIP